MRRPAYGPRSGAGSLRASCSTGRSPSESISQTSTATRPSLVVEVDGAEHRTELGIEQDRVRDQYMNSMGISVLRFSNQEILESAEGVLAMIKEKLLKK